MSEETHAEPHDHTVKYVTVWALLTAALVVSLIIGTFHVEVVTVTLIFSIALMKAYMVIAHFMHVKGAPAYVKWILATGVVCLYIAFFGFVTDIVFAPPHVGR